MAEIVQTSQQALSETEKIAKDTTDLEKGRSHKDATEGQIDQDEAFLVTFIADDPGDPKNWSKKMKWGVTLALSATGFNRIMVSTVHLPTFRLHNFYYLISHSSCL